MPEIDNNDNLHMSLYEIEAILEELVSEGLASKTFDKITGEPLYKITGKGIMKLNYDINHKN